MLSDNNLIAGVAATLASPRIGSPGGVCLARGLGCTAVDLNIQLEVGRELKAIVRIFDFRIGSGSTQARWRQSLGDRALLQHDS